MALLHITLDLVQKEYQKKAPEWHDSQWNHVNRRFLEKECNQPSEFDPTNIRQRMIDRNIEQSIVRTCTYGTIHAIFSSQEQNNDIPWSLWARILRLFYHKKPFTVFFLAAPHIRELPAPGETITPYNINGGYTYSCNHDTIIIYRAEDATRVLIHELQHSSCLDHHELGVDRVEAETEAWAELMYCALLSEGKTHEFHKLIRQQSAWIQSQNEKVRSFIKDTRSFPWRYTVGKEEVWRRWGIVDGAEKYKRNIHVYNKSLRLTMPPSRAIKKLFGVSENSIIL
jgi:hypothetical protein